MAVPFFLLIAPRPHIASLTRLGGDYRWAGGRLVSQPAISQASWARLRSLTLAGDVHSGAWSVLPETSRAMRVYTFLAIKFSSWILLLRRIGSYSQHGLRPIALSMQNSSASLLFHLTWTWRTWLTEDVLPHTFLKKIAACA